MADFDPTSFDSMFAALKADIPETWGPRRPQPEWDRDFGGNADINEHFGHRTDKAHMWLAFCLNFSATLVDGFEGKENVINFGRETVKAHVPKGKKQFDA